MRTFPRTLVMVGVLLALLTQRSLAAEADFTGRWKLVVSPLTDIEFLIWDAEKTDGKLSVKIVNSAGLLRSPEIRQLQQDGSKLSFVLGQDGAEDSFTGTLKQDGPRAGQILGTLNFRGRTYAARLEKTEDDKTGRPGPSPELRAYSEALGQRDPQVKVEKLQAALEEASGPVAAAICDMILQNAAAAELSVEDVNKVIDKLLAVGADYGQPLVTEFRTRALKALQGKKPYAELALKLAQESEQALGDKASLQDQASILSVIATSAKLLDKKDLAAATEARLAKIETALDEEYHHKVPPFKPTAFSGRAEADQDRVVVMELFTGAQCPPCVAADVAFDALISSYPPKDLITLQYHLHIPGPDPLTNADTVARAKYYAVNSTPSTFFNGQADAGGGGGMANAESKFGQYREVIDRQLAGKKQGKIELDVKRSGDNIVVTARAQARLPDQPADEKAGDKADEKAGDKADEKTKQPQLRLRLVLIEEAIRYVGGNQLRFHHHVVRGFPGGVEGKELVATEAAANETIDLNQVRQTIDDYLASYQAQRSFPNPLPPIELKNLSIVAFLQNDADKSILHAVMAPVPNE